MQGSLFPCTQNGVPICSSADEMVGLSDGLVIGLMRQMTNQRFASEKDLVDYLVFNINVFCKDVLGDELISFQLERQVNPRPRYRSRRVDMYVEGKERNYVVEAKNPKNLMENRQAIGQLLDYGREFLDPKKDLVLLTTRYDLDTALTITHYNLPIRYIFFGETQTMECVGSA